ncbi:MAG: DUF3375 family protein [Legionellaceae bacterium]|nr:DUF3375 family protein [Legionellaceae bacterium]
MEHYLKLQIEQSPAVMLLRSDNAGFIISFFQSVFGETQRFQIGYKELVTSLTQYNESHDKPLTRRPSDYIEIWADENHRFLRKYYIDGNDEPQTELSHEVSSMMSWLHSQGTQDFVGTESRVSALFQMIDKLASHSDTDPKARISKLKQDREAIEQEINQIKKTGTVLSWDDLRKREYLSHIMEDSRRLLADFALIEDIFKDHARQLKEKMVAAQLSKGDLLAQVLDMHDALEESDQGKSFRAFWDFLISPTKQGELSRWLEKILQDLSDKPYLKGMQHREYVARLKGFKSDLLQRGRKVLASQSRLTREIRTLLVQSSNHDSRAIQAAILDIKAWCIADRERFAHIAGETLIEIEHKPLIHLPLERPLWSEPIGALLDFGNVLDNLSIDEVAIGLKEHSALACWQLEERVAMLLQKHTSFTLPELVDVYPPEFALEELVGYLSIGMKSPQHLVDQVESVKHDEFLVPQITFHRLNHIPNRMTTNTSIERGDV